MLIVQAGWQAGPLLAAMLDKFHGAVFRDQGRCLRRCKSAAPSARAASSCGYSEAA